MNLFIYLNLFYIVYLNQVSPHDEGKTIVTETFNEVFLTLICYHFILLTDLISDPELKLKIGNSLVGFIIAMIACNLVIIVTESLKPLLRSFRLKRLQKKHAEAMANRLLE